MLQITDALEQLVSGYPKQATATIDMLMNSNKQFFRILADLITGEAGYQLSGKMLKAGIVTLNTLAIRCKNKMGIQDFLTLEEIFSNMKAVLASEKVSFQNKKLLTPSLSQLIAGYFSTHKQILQLKSQLVQSQKLCCTPIYLHSILNSSHIEKSLKMESVNQLFEQALFQINYFTLIFNNQYDQVKITHLNGTEQIITAQACFGRAKYFVDVLAAIFEDLFKGQLASQYERQSMMIIVDSEAFANFLFSIIQWNQGQYQFLSLHDLKLQSKQTIQSHEINNIKQKIFKILSILLRKTNPDYNFFQHSHKIFSAIPSLCLRVLKEVTNISHSFEELDEEYLVGSLCDNLIKFLAQCLKFNDLVALFAENLNLTELVRCSLNFSKIRATDISGEEDGEYFSNFLEGFAGKINANQISRYAITQFIQACCQKFDSFPSALFITCYNNLLLKIKQRLPKTEDFYQHLYLSYQTMSDNLLHQITDIQIKNCLIGIICLQNQVEARKDFQHAIQQFMAIMDIQHFQQTEPIMVFYILGSNLTMFKNAVMLDACQRIISMAFKCAETNQGCAVMCFQFVTVFYQKLIAVLDFDHSLSTKYIDIAQNVIWHQLIKCFEMQKIAENQDFYSTLLEFLALPQNCTAGTISQGSSFSSNCKRLIISTVADYLFTQISKFAYIILQRCCTQQLKLLSQNQHSRLLVLRVNQAIVQCLQLLDWALRTECQSKIKTIPFGQYANLVGQMIDGVLKIANDGQSQSQPTVQQILNQVQLLSILIVQQQKQCPNLKPSTSRIPQSLFNTLLPTLLCHPFGTPWLICICEFTHRINAKFTLSQIDSITKMINSSFTNCTTSQLKLNQLSLFAIVLLNYYQPESWHPIHQLIRTHMVKLMKIDQQNKVERRKQMLRFGYESQTIFGTTIIRLFHVYLFGFKMEPNNQLLFEVFCYLERFVQKYCIVQAAHLVIGFKSSYRQINSQNFQKILDLTLLILNKLITNTNYYGHETSQQSRIRKLSQKIGCMPSDPYQQFRLFVKQLEVTKYNLIDNPKFADIIKSTMSINTCKGQPRKLYSIVKPKV